MDTHDRSRRTVFTAVGVTTTIQAIATMASLTVAIFAPQAAETLGVPPESIGVYASLTYVGAMIGSLITGGFVLRYGAIRTSQFALVLCVIGLGICVGATWWWFVLSALLFGIGYGPATPASSHLLSRHTPPRFLSLVFSLKQTGVPLGSVLAGLIVPFLLIRFDWQTVTVIVASTLLSVVVALQYWRRRFDAGLVQDQPLLRGNLLTPLKLIFSRPGLRTIAIATFFFSATQQCYIYFLVTYLELELNWTTQAAGFAMSVLGVTAVFGRVAWGAIADATGKNQLILGLIAVGMAISTAITALFAADWPSWWIYLTCALFGITGAAWNGVYLAEITRNVAPNEVSHATGGGLFITFGGVMVTPPLFGLLIDYAGEFSTGYVTLSAINCLVGFVLVTSAFRLNAD